MNETREQIIQVAGRLFLQSNYDGVSIQDITRASGMTKGALYHHFASKEQLFEQVDKHMLKANFGNNDGEKYERNTTCWGLNCPPTGCADLAGKYDGDGDASEIVQLAQVCATGSAATWLAEAAKIVDVDALLADYAVEAVTADIDSMAAAGQNVTIYVNQDTGLLQVIPTGQDLDLGNSTAFYPLATPWGLPNSWCPGRIDNFYARLWSTPAAHDALMAKIQALHCGAMSNATLLPLIDAYHELLKQDLYFLIPRLQLLF